MKHPVNYLETIKTGMNYKIYRSLINELLTENKTSGDNHSAFMVNYTKDNVQRMNHLDETVVLNDDLLKSLEELPGSYIFLVLTEAWCGDASQIVPVFDKIAEASNGKVELKLIWRDKNLELMDQYLTNGGRSIPKLIIVEKDTLSVSGDWGPRPKVSQELYNQWKSDGLNMVQISEKLHNWYAEDKTVAIQEEIIELIKRL